MKRTAFPRDWSRERKRDVTQTNQSDTGYSGDVSLDFIAIINAVLLKYREILSLSLMFK